MARPQCDTPFVGLRAVEENTTNSFKVYNYSEKQNSEYPVIWAPRKAFGPLVSLFPRFPFCLTLFKLYDPRSTRPLSRIFQVFHATPLRVSHTWKRDRQLCFSRTRCVVLLPDIYFVSFSHVVHLRSLC